MRGNLFYFAYNNICTKFNIPHLIAILGFLFLLSEKIFFWEYREPVELFI